MTTAKCPACKKTGEYHHRSFRLAWWRPVRKLDCRFCGREFDIPLLPGVTDDRVKAELETDNARSRATDPRLWVGEFWVQVYVAEAAAEYGLKVAEPIRPRGPDFILLQGRRRVGLEVEVRWHNYLEHGHHLDERFRKTSTMLAVLHPVKPTTSFRRLLPRRIVYLRPDHFLKWKAGPGRRFALEVADLERGQFSRFELARLGMTGVPPERQRELSPRTIRRFYLR